ncbi:MAG TPA: TonB family protein [Thermoanaerobaculia bacterium]|nr:TonB family protein [Thermoanaerobaculia bacterium]
MRDAVADVLLERRALARISPLGFAASLMLHALLGLVMIVGVRRHPTDLRPLLMVNLAPSSRPAATAAQLAPPSRPAPAVPSPVIVPEPVAEKTKETISTTKKAVDTSLFGRSEAKPAKASTPPPPSKQATTTPPSTGIAPGAGEFPLPGIGTAGVTGIEGGDFPYTIYIDRMIALIGRNWFRPQVGGDAITRVYFVIERDGRVRDAEVRVASGNGTFDRAALRAVIESSPLPPLPFGYSGTYLGVHLTFH